MYVYVFDYYRVLHLVEPGLVLMSLTELTWKCCPWWPSRFSPFKEVCTVSYMDGVKL